MNKTDIRQDDPTLLSTPRRARWRLMPGHMAALFGLAVVCCGTVLLALPWATVSPRPLPLLDALFMAISATCVTGLVVVDPAHEFTQFGQLVIVSLIQIGGLGYAMIATLFFLAAGRRISLWHRMLLAETLSTLDLAGLIRLAQFLIAATFVSEALGGLILGWRFAQYDEFSGFTAFYYGIFHSISALNNAGFSLFSTNLEGFHDDPVVLITVACLIVVGGLGFLVIYDLLERWRGRRAKLELQSILVLIMTIGLIVVGSVAILGLENENPRTLGAFPMHDRVLNAGFQAVSARTAGFNSIAIADCHLTTLFVLVLLMFVGGSPGGTAGGIKTTTLAVVALTTWHLVRHSPDISCFRRRLAPQLVLLAFALVVLHIALLVTLTLILTFTDEAHHFLNLLFEVASALGTVGFSVGDGGTLSLSAALSDAGKIVIMLAMLVGRFGPLALGLLAVRPPARPLYRFPLAKVAIG